MSKVAWPHLIPNQYNLDVNELPTFFHRSGYTGTRRTGGRSPSSRKRPSACDTTASSPLRMRNGVVVIGTGWNSQTPLDSRPQKQQWLKMEGGEGRGVLNFTVHSREIDGAHSAFSLPPSWSAFCQRGSSFILCTTEVVLPPMTPIEAQKRTKYHKAIEETSPTREKNEGCLNCRSAY